MFAILRTFMGSPTTETGSYRCLVVENGIVINAVMLTRGLSKEEEWQPPDGCILVESDEGGIGWLWDGDKLIDPNPLPGPVTISPGEGMKVV